MSIANTDDVLCAARALVRGGYAVHWLKPRSKQPVAFGWQHAPKATTRTLHRTYAREMNVGVRCGRWSEPQPECGLVVLDVDVKDVAFCDAVQAALVALCSDMSQVPTVRSGSGKGGRHLWYACPLDRLPEKAACTIARSTQILDGTRKRVWQIEVLSTGKNLVVPPSIHPDTGCAYIWLTPPSGPLPLLPEAVHSAITAASQGAESAPGWHLRHRRSQAGAGILEGERNTVLFAIACAMRDRGQTFDPILAELLDVNAARCIPPLDAKEIKTIARSVLRYTPTFGAIPVTTTRHTLDAVTLPGVRRLLDAVPARRRGVAEEVA